MIKAKPCNDKTFLQLKISTGIRLEKFSIPFLRRWSTTSGLRSTGLGFAMKSATIIPPIKTPATKKRFHECCLQLYLKKGMSDGKQAAQICRSDEEIPNDLLPSKRSRGTTRPINGPATYHGQGRESHSPKFITGIQGFQFNTIRSLWMGSAAKHYITAEL